MGALFRHMVASASFDDFSRWVREHGYHVYGTSARGSRDYREIDRYERPAILLLGSEREGLTDEQAAICQELLRLPMYGRASSLNLAVAAGILLYDMIDDRQ
jgi:TrmH family RNA methyltransferase